MHSCKKFYIIALNSPVAKKWQGEICRISIYRVKCKDGIAGMKKQVRKKTFAAAACFLFLLLGQLLLPMPSVQAAQKVESQKQLEQVFKKQIGKGKQTISFTAPGTYTTAQIQDALVRAAKSVNRLLAGRVSLSRRAISGQNGYAQYTIVLSDDALMKVKTLHSKKAAVKAAAKALKNGAYKVNFYSEDSYYEVFSRLLLQHPEYNYGTAVWRNTNGAYGYRRNSSLTRKQQSDKMAAADQAAAQAVNKCIKPQMTAKQKARAVHDYIIRNCRYGGSVDAYTAYGALVDGVAVCQGYAAAFNLMAQKCGLQSMAVCGTTRGGAHAWTYVKIGKKYQYVDCTWDDTGTLGNGIIHVYFLVDAQKMKEQHVWQETEFPAADIKYNKYFISAAG